MANVEVNYNEQMLNYYPEVIKAIREFQVLIETQSLEVEALSDELAKILENAYVVDCDESTLARWEKALAITPLPNSDDSDRRETILARLYNTPKLNSKAIEEMVKIFTHSNCVSKSFFRDGILNILVGVPDKKSFKFENLEQELRKKIPAHIQLQISREYRSWWEIYQGDEPIETWGGLENKYATWDEALYPQY